MSIKINFKILSLKKLVSLNFESRIERKFTSALLIHSQGLSFLFPPTRSYLMKQGELIGYLKVGKQIISSAVVYLNEMW